MTNPVGGEKQATRSGLMFCSLCSKEKTDTAERSARSIYGLDHRSPLELIS